MTLLSDRFKQTRDYNCAAGAVAYFVNRHSGLVLDVEKVTTKLGCHPETGTTHGSIVGYLDYLYRYDGVKLEYGHDIRVQEFTLPMIVNYWSGEDGHYGVITDTMLGSNWPDGEGVVGLFDPSSGKGIQLNWSEFVKNWYSPRYGKNWGLYIARKGT